MKYLLFALLLFGANLEIYSGSKKEKNALLAKSWQKQYMPFINPETQEPYNFRALSLLALLCGPFIMLESVLRLQSSNFDIRESDKYEKLFDIRLNLIEKQPALDPSFTRNPKDRFNR